MRNSTAVYSEPSELPGPKGALLRSTVRYFLVALGVVFTSPLWAGAWLLHTLGLGDGPLASFSQFLSMFPGLPGLYLRRGFYWVSLERFNVECGIGFGTWFSHPQVVIDRGVSIGAGCTIGMCEIAADATIGSNVDILSGRRQHDLASADLPLQKRGGVFTKVHIGRNTWIGNSTVIMADIGEGSVVGAGSVVVKPVPPSFVAVGTAAVIKRSLFPTDG